MKLEIRINIFKFDKNLPGYYSINGLTETCDHAIIGGYNTTRLRSLKKEGNMKNIPEVGTVKLCGVQGCCPTIDFTDPQKIVLKDDFGGQVQLTQDQWVDLKAKFGSKADQQG